MVGTFRKGRMTHVVTAPVDMAYFNSVFKIDCVL